MMSSKTQRSNADDPYRLYFQLPEERVGKYHKFEVVNGVQGKLKCRMDSGELLVHIDRQSLIEHIEALQGGLDKQHEADLKELQHRLATIDKERDDKHKAESRVKELEAKLAIAEVNVVEWRHCAKVNECLKISAEQANANLSAALLGAGEKLERLTSRGFEDLHDENERLKSKLKKTEKLKQDYFEQCGVLRDIINRAKVDPNSDQANESVIDNSYTGQIAQQSRTIRIAQNLLRIADCPNCDGTGSCGIEGVGLLPCQWCEEKQAIISQDD